MSVVALKSSRLTDLAWDLSQLDRDGGLDVAAVEGLLADFYSDLGKFKAELLGMTRPDFDLMLPRSRETPSHFKWYCSSSANPPFTVWLHEYKRSGVRSAGYAQTVHNHRYAMSSVILAGGYRHTWYLTEQESGVSARIYPLSRENLTTGRVYSLTATEFHSVTDVEDGTVTLVVQQRAQRGYSTSIDVESGRIARHFPIESRFDQLRRVFEQEVETAP